MVFLFLIFMREEPEEYFQHWQLCYFLVVFLAGFCFFLMNTGNLGSM